MNAVFASDRRAASVLEFALVTPVLVVLGLGLADFGNAIQQQVWLEQATRAGGMAALSDPQDQGAIEAAVTAASWSTVSIAVASSAECSSGAALAADGTCPSGALYLYDTITATVPFQAFILPITSLEATDVEQVP